MPVLLAQPGTRGQGEQVCVVHAQGGVAQVGLALGERCPGRRGGDGLDEAGGGPLVEPDRPEARGGEQGGSSVKRNASLVSQSSSVGVGVVSQTSSSNGAR